MEYYTEVKLAIIFKKSYPFKYEFSPIATNTCRRVFISTLCRVIRNVCHRGKCVSLCRYRLPG